MNIQTDFSEMNSDGFNDDFERIAFNRQRAEVLSSVFLYDEDEEARARVDADDYASVYSVPRMRGDESLYVMGRELALTVDTDLADMPMDLAQRAIERVEDEGRRNGYRERFNQLGAKGGDTAQDYYRLYAQVERDNVQGTYRAQKQKLAAMQESVRKMELYVRGDDMVEGGAESFSEQDLANVRSVVDKKTLDDATAVRHWMQTYVKPLAEKTDAEEMMRTLDGLEDEFFEVIGQDAQRAEMAYMAMMHWAEGVKQSNKVGVADELIVAVGKKLSNWADPRTGAIFATQGAIGPAGAINLGALQSASSQIQSAYKDGEERRAARSILRAAINKGMELGDDVNWWVGTARTAAQMTGDTLPYLLPYVGPAVGTLDVFSTGLTETADQLQLAGLSGAQAGGQALIETGVQAAVELMPFGKVGGWGLSKMTRRFFGESMEQGRAGKFARWVVRNTQKSTARALLAEGAASFADEAILEPVAGGIMTYGAEHTFDMLGVPHGRSREFYECFDELKTLFTDPHQAAGLLLFTAGLTGAGAYGVHQNVKYFARHRKMWEAAGLTPEQVDKVMAADDSVAVGSKMVDEGWQSDPAGMRKRVLEVCGEMAERGEVLVLTGEGALNPELENSELAEAYRAVWQEYQERGLLPKVEAVGNNQFRITKEGVDITLDAKGADAYLQHAIDEVDIAETRELQKRAGKGHYVDLRSELATAVSKIAGGAAMRAVEATSERSGIAVEDLTRGLPEFLAEPIRQKGMVTLTDAQNITEWALGVIDGLVQEGMSPADARMTRPSAQGMARSLGDWATFARDFAHRERLAGYKRGEGAITIGRTRNSTETQFDGKRVLGQTLMTIPGQVRHFGAVEDVTESFFDMLIQERAAVLLGDEVESATAQQRADAEAEALKELGDIVKRARAAVMKADPSAAIEEVKDGDKMSIIEALSTMATSKFLTSGVVPKWMQSLTQALVGNLEAAEALSKVRTAYAGVMEKEPAAVSELENLLNRLGVHVQDVFREARIEAVDIQAWKSAQAITGARAAGAMGSGGAAVSAVKAEAEEHEDEIVRNERMAEPEPEVAPNPTRDAKEAREVLQQMAPAGNAPADMKGVFVDDQCYYNQAGGFWCGMIRKSDLRDGTEQVKIGQKGKHGVIAGKELTGRFQHSVGAIYVWRRKNGELQVISGRHRFAKLMEDAEAEYCNAYVFNEDEEHDERWARMLDYENNMRDDQADELTAATYVRETGLTDAELKDRGLMRNGTRCKRGALIGRFARQELWTRFKNGVIEPKDAEIICNLTRNISRQERIEEIQTRCCMLLEAKKSWEFIGGMVQLMANKEMVTMKQGLLDFGADFEADLARAAEWIERNIKAINESITLLKQGKKLSGKKRAEAERLGITTATQEGAEEMLRDLEMLKGQFELIGSYPDLIAQAQMWDGKTEVDPVGRYLEQAHAEREQAAAEGEMDADEYLAEQARKEAAEAVPSLFGSTMSMYKARTGADKFAPDVRGKEPVLSVNVHAMLENGSKATKNDLIADESGNVFWGRLPELDELKNKGYGALDIILRLGGKSDGFNHIVHKHGQWIMDAMGIDEPILACKRFIAEVLQSVKKINYITNGKRASLIAKSGEASRYFIVAIGKDAAEPKYACIKTAFVASVADRYDSDIAIYEGKDALELRIPMSSFGENQRFRGASERQDRSSDYPVAAASSPSRGMMPEVGNVVKHEELISYKNGEFSANMERNLAAVTPEMDARYIEAVKRDDMDAAQRMVNDVARMRGYMPDSDYQGSECFNGAAPCANAYFDTDEERHEAWENGDFEGTVSLADFVRRGMDPGELEWLITAPGAYQRADEYKRESIEAIRKAKASKRGKVTIYRAVRADIKEGSVRNGDWITFSKAYAEYHINLQDWEKGRIIKQVVSIDDVWWDGNDVNEWGYDDGKEYAYRNTANNRKLLDSVTYDKNGDVVPLSKRFDYSSGDVSFNVVGPRAKNWDKIKHRAFKGRDDGMLRAEIDASRAMLKSEALRGKNLRAYRQIIADWNELPEAERKEVEAYAELCAERDEAANKLNETTENDFQEAYAVANKLDDEVNSKRVKVREIIGEFFKMKGADGSVGITAKNEIIDAMAVDFWCEWGSDKVENSLASDPMAMGMALMDVLDYPELYEAYPQLESLSVYTEDLKGYYGLAGNNGWSDYIMMNRSLLDNWEQFRSTLLHEVQHVIQRIEGFAKGGNKESVRRKVKELLEGTGARIDMLERDLRWFSAVDIARDLLKEARRLRRYPNAWKRSGRRFEFARMSDSAEEIREKILRDIAERYNEFRREDTSETLLLDMPDLLLPEVHFHSVDSIEAGLAALDKLKSRKLVFRGTAAKKNRRLKELQKHHDAMQKVLSEFEYEPYELYVRLAGEIESRNVQERRDWTMAERLARPFNDTLEYPGEALVTYSMERASLRALDVLRGRADERAGETLIKDWQRACEAWNQLAGDGEGRLGNGAKMLGEMQALIGATKGVLPQKYCRMGHLNGLMRWAGIYARMQQDGELPKAGVIKGPIYQKFVERMQKGDELNRVQGMSEAEAKEAIALLAGERLDVAMLKVANECRRRLELFLKDREKERIDWIVERAYPKRQRGQQWPRGKMAAEAYRRMERAYELMKMQPDDLAELIKETKRKLSDLDSSDEEFEAKEEALEDELFLAQTFGAWDNMSFEQARRASGAMAEMVLAGRNEWQEKLRGERRRADYDRRRIAGNFKTSRRDSVKKRAKDAAKEKANRLAIGQAIVRGGMSYAQLMLALEPKLGKEFTGRQIRMIAKAHEEIQLFNQERSRWMYKTLAAITGLKKEGDIEEWINANNEIFDTGIVLTPKMVRKCRLTPEEAREWLAMTAEERAERRAKMLAEAEARKEEPDNIPEESQMDELRRKLAASEENGTMPREYELRLETKVEQPLHCTKEALLFAILTFEQDDYKRLMEVNGVTEAQLKRMRELVGPKLLAWGYAMRDKLSEHGERMAELYEAYTGVPFAKRANYFRGVFDNALAKDNGEAIDVQNAITGGKYGIIIPRQYHNQKINWSTSATQVGLSTLNQQQNYISTAHITREWRTLLSNQEFEKRMRAEIGDTAMNMIHGWTKLIDGSVMVDAKVQASFKRFFGRLLSAYAVGRLAGNVYTVMKQGSALLNGLVGGRMPERVLENNAVVQQMTYRHIGVGEYLGYLAKAMSGRTEIRWSEIEAAGYIAGRKQEQGHHLEQAAMLAPGQKVPSKLGRKGRAVYEGNMEVIGWADRKSNTVAALAVAEAVYQQAKAENKDGMVPDAELRRVAIQTAGLMIELAAQPQLRTQKNYWAASGALGALGDFFFMFKSEALAKMGVYIAQMFAGNHKAWLAGWLSFGVANSLVLALIDYIRGYWPDDDDEDKWQKRGLSFGTNVLFLDITSVPLLGDFAAWAQAEILGEKPWRSSIADMVMPFGDIWNAGKREVKNIRKAKGWDEHVAAMCSLARALGTSGGWVQNGRSVPVGTCAELALATAAISNIVRFGKDAVKFFMDED